MPLFYKQNVDISDKTCFPFTDITLIVISNADLFSELYDLSSLEYKWPFTFGIQMTLNLENNKTCLYITNIVTAYHWIVWILFSTIHADI